MVLDNWAQQKSHYVIFWNLIYPYLSQYYVSRMYPFC